MKTIFVYDLDLSNYTVDILNKTCNVIVRKFHKIFQGVPRHVFELRTYAFKSLCIHDALVFSRASGVLWVDSSVRILGNSFGSVLNHIQTKSNGIGIFTDTGHSIFSATHSDMLEYLIMPSHQAKHVQMLDAATIMVYKTEQVYNNVLKWYVLCSLDRKCIAPKGNSLHCRFARSDRYYKFANCHRFDQSAVNILLSNGYKHNESLYLFSSKSVTIRRGGAALSEMKVAVCT